MATDPDLLVISESGPQGPIGPMGDVTPEALAAKEAAEQAATQAAADRVQTGLDRVATGQDKTATAADRVQTGLDRTATTADAAATAADRVQTGLDRVATGQDKTATAADRVQTGLDRVATGQDKTATAADRVQTGLDRVATGEDKTATAADRVQTGLDRVATGEDKTATAADRVQTGLDRVATGEDKTATAADRVQTGLDRTAGSTSATNASNSANAAAASAAQAAQAIAGLFINGIAGNAVPAVPVPVSGPALAGHHYRITSAGTSQAKTWAIGDAAIYNGASGSWTQLTGFFAGATAYTDNLVAQRVGVDQIISDGTTTGRGMYQFGGTRCAVAGAPVVTGRWWVPPMAANPAASAYLGGIYGALTGEPAGVNNSLSVFIAASGELRVVAKGANQATDFRQFGRANFRSAYLASSGGTLEVAVNVGTGNPVIRWNDLNISAEFGGATGGAAPDWLAPTLGTAHLVGAFAWPAGAVPVGGWILGTLTDADRTYWRTTGKPPLWVALGGSAQNQVTGSTGTFEGGSTGWSSVNSTIAVSSDFARTGSSSLKITSTQNNSDFIGPNVGLITLGMARGGGAGLLCCWVYRPAGSTWSPSSTRFLRPDNVATAVMGPLVGTLVDDTWCLFERQIFAHWGTTTLYGGGVIGDVAYIDDLQYIEHGALSLQLIQPGRVVGDGTIIGDNPARLVGMTQVTDRKTWIISANTATNGNEQLLGGAILDNAKDVIDSMEQATTGTPTTTVGSASGGAQYKASSALTAGINPATLVTRRVASDVVWVGSNSTTPVRTTITGHRAN